MRDHRIRLRRKLSVFMKSFLESLYFNVKVNGEVSKMRVQENGIAQGSVLSLVLFLVKINELAKLVPVE